MITSSKNYEWYLSQDFSKYSGKWLAIIDQKIIASGKNVEKLINKVKDKYPNNRPFITKIRNKLSIL